ncbi:MAG: diguanylate cyclase, partial [Sulfurimonadaceae bacterium]|nr:diguanylate cyclase [Sulfurimonadaceae bacterium]
VRDYLFVKDESTIRGLEDLEGKTLAIPDGYMTILEVGRKYPKIKILKTRSIMDSIASVLSGEADATLEVQAVMAYTLKSNAIEGIKVVAQDDVEVHPLHMLVQKENKILLSILNKALKSIDIEEQNKIADDWIHISYKGFIDKDVAIKILLVIFVIFILGLYRQSILSKYNTRLEENQKIINKYLSIVDEHVITSTTDTEGIITDISSAYCDISGYTKEECIGSSNSIVKSHDTPEEVYEDLWKTIKAGGTWHGEFKDMKKNGEIYWLDTTITPQFNGGNKITGYTAICHDITDKKIIETISITDALTQIYNRRHFNELFPKTINSAKRHNEIIYLLMMDIDHFKQYNDTYGHQMGDEVLRSVGSLLKSKLKRADDSCFRVGGEEFAVLFKSDDCTSALRFANTIKDSIEALQIEHSGNSASAFVTVSVGLVCCKVDDTKNAEAIYSEADEQLYRAKNSGRNRVCSSN